MVISKSYTWKAAVNERTILGGWFDPENDLLLNRDRCRAIASEFCARRVKDDVVMVRWGYRRGMLPPLVVSFMICQTPDEPSFDMI